MSDAEKGWSDYWGKDNAEGEVFVNAKGGPHPALQHYWQEKLAGRPDAARIIDLASGAGSIFAHLPDSHSYELFAADISEVAINALAERFPDVATIVCSADEVPHEDGAFDVVVSQFGVEYAGIDAFSEVARLLAPDGEFSALCHVEDGYIDSSNKAQLLEAELAADAGFIDTAMRLTKAVFAADSNELKNAEHAFVEAATQVGNSINRCKKGVHTHLFLGFRELYEKRQQYDLADITEWLDGMRAELDLNIDRLSRMCKAALSESDIAKIKILFKERGIDNINCSTFETLGNKLPVAWNITARRGS